MVVRSNFGGAELASIGDFVFSVLGTCGADYADLVGARHSGGAAVQIDPHTVRLPVVDGKGLRFTRLSPADGLSHTRVTQIVQDDQGFLWFGTGFGLNRYDGYKFKVFMHDPRQPNSIGDNSIMALFKDRSGMLWVSTNRFLDRLDPTTEKFTHYQVDADDPAGIVVHISQDRTGMLWLASGTGPPTGPHARKNQTLSLGPELP